MVQVSYSTPQFSSTSKLLNSIVGDDMFFLRACDPSVPGSDIYCQRWDDTNLLWTEAIWHTLTGWSWNNTYQSCQGDSRQLGMMLLLRD